MDINDIILIKFLNGECSTDELQAVERWLEADEAHGKELFGWEAAHRMAGASSMGGREVEQRLRELHGRIDAECRKTDRRVCRRQWLLRAAIFVGVIIMGTAVCWLVGEDGILRSPKMLVASTSGPHSRDGSKRGRNCAILPRSTARSGVWNSRARDILKWPKTTITRLSWREVLWM